MSFTNKDEAKKAGWHSRRHQSAEVSQSTRIEREARLRDKIARVEQRRIERENRSPEDQISELDVRLGVNIGASRERVRLQAQIKARNTKNKGNKKNNK